MHKKATVVTAFFDIGRGKFKISTAETRTDSKYIEYFHFWCRLRNRLVVYTSKEYKEIILKIREKFGLLDQTIVVTVDDIFSIEKKLYQRMQKVSGNDEFKKIRFYDSAMSNRADYDYIMLMKYWCMTDAVERGLAEDDVVWLDFGFNHGGEVFVKSDEFDFELIGETNGKIQIYALTDRDPEKVHSGQSFLMQFDTINGSLVAAPASLCGRLYKMCKEAMNALISLDCIDDDQQLLLMAYKIHPEEFEIHQAWWFMPLKEYWGGMHLTAKLSSGGVSDPIVERNRLLFWIRKVYLIIFKRTQNQKDLYAERMKKIAEHYY